MLSTCQLVVHVIPVHRTRRQHILVSTVNHFETRRDICILRQSILHPHSKRGKKSSDYWHQPVWSMTGASSVEGLQRTQACKSLVSFLSSPLAFFRFFFAFCSRSFFFPSEKRLRESPFRRGRRKRKKKKKVIPCSLRAGVTLHSAVSFSF